MIYLFLTVLAAMLVIEWRKRGSDAMAYEATIDYLRRYQVENETLRARLAALEAPPDYLKGESE